MTLNLFHKGNIPLAHLNTLEDSELDHYFRLMCLEYENKNRKH